MAEAVFVACLGTVLVVGSGVFGALAEAPELRAGAAAVVCTLALALYLLIVRAGRVLIGAVVLTGLALSVLTPRVTAEIVLTERGLRQEVIVTAVHAKPSPAGGAPGLRCSYALEDGGPLAVPTRRGCPPTASAGDRIPVLFDPKGVLTPRAAGAFRLGRFIGTVALALLLPLLCFITVMRSHRLPPAHAAGQRAAVRS